MRGRQRIQCHAFLHKLVFRPDVGQVLKAMHAAVLPRVLQWVQDTRPALFHKVHSVAPSDKVHLSFSGHHTWPKQLSPIHPVPLQIGMEEKYWFSLLQDCYFHFPGLMLSERYWEESFTSPEFFPLEGTDCNSL